MIFYSPSKDALEQLAKDLVRQYPALGHPSKKEFGWQMYFFNSSHGGGPHGFLEERLKSQRKKLHKHKEKVIMESDNCSLCWDSEEEGKLGIRSEIKVANYVNNFEESNLR